MKQVPLSQGKFALVDDEDFDRVMKFKWSYANNGRNAYATRHEGKGKNRRTCFMHRFILPHDLPNTDHIDHDTLNNQKSNLRPCTPVQNGQNRKIQKHSSKFKGVHFYKMDGNWQININVNKKRVHLGYCKYEEEAAHRYDAAAIFFFGPFAKTNFKQGVES